MLSLTRAAALLLAAACGRSQADAGPAQRAVTDSTLRAAGTDPTQWATFGGSYSNARYTPLAQIDSTNVRDLRLAWRHEIGSSWSERLRGWRNDPRVWYRPSTWAVRPHQWGKEKQASTPVVVDGVIYYTGAYNLVMAVDAATGAQRWQYQHRMQSSPMLCCGPQNRGVAVYGDRVFVATLDAQLLALDRRTGRLAWQVQLADPKQFYSATMAPLAADGKVIVGVSGSEYAIRGRVDAYDAATGQRAWRFWTVPSPEEGGWWGKWVATTPEGDSLHRDLARERADSARYAESWRTGGGGMFMTPAYDPALGLLYAGVGNPSPALDGTTRPGDNLYTGSLVALDVRTGKLRWYYQLVPHDVLDTDAGNPLVLFDTRAGGETVPAVGHASKNGWVYVLDRRTGKRVVRSEPFVPQQNVFARPTRDGLVVYPAMYGGAVAGLPAYSPRTGLLYVLGMHHPTFVRSGGGGMFGGSGGLAEAREPDAPWGALAAVDVVTGRIRWRQKTPAPLTTSGALATAGDLLFYGDGDSLVVADARTGRALRRLSTGGRIDGPPVSFALKGRQYVAVVSRAGLVAFTLSEPPAGR